MSKKKKIVVSISIAITLILVGVVIWFIFSGYRMDILKAQYEDYEEKYVEDVQSEISFLYERVNDDVSVMDYVKCEEYIVACGARYTYGDDNAVYPWLAMFDSDKEIVWEIDTDNGINREEFNRIVIEEDMIYALSRRHFGTDIKLAITSVNMEGKVQDYRVTDFNCEVFGCAEKIGDSYFISMWSDENEEKVAKVEGDDSFTTILVNDSEYRYVVQDMMVYNNKLYISCYEVPEGDYVGESAEFYGINGELIDNRNYKGSVGEIYFDRKQMEILRDNYTAHLFVWDAETNECKKVYTEKQAVGAQLNENEAGQLVCKVQKFEKGLYSLATSSFSVETINSVHEFVFDADAKLLNKNKLGKCVYFRR